MVRGKREEEPGTRAEPIGERHEIRGKK